MYSGHEALDNLEVIMDDLGQGSEAVGCAGGVGNDLQSGGKNKHLIIYYRYIDRNINASYTVNN